MVPCFVTDNLALAKDYARAYEFWRLGTGNCWVAAKGVALNGWDWRGGASALR